MLDTNDADFQNDVLSSPIPVVVDFYADWCGPCKMLASTLARVEIYFKDRVKFVKVNVDDNAAVSSKYGVRGIPTLQVFKAGQLVGVKVGAATQNDVMQWIEDNI